MLPTDVGLSARDLKSDGRGLTASISRDWVYLPKSVQVLSLSRRVSSSNLLNRRQVVFKFDIGCTHYDDRRSSSLPLGQPRSERYDIT